MFRNIIHDCLTNNELMKMYRQVGTYLVQNTIIVIDKQVTNYFKNKT